MQLEEGCGLNEDALRAHCRELLAAYKVPKRIVQIDEMPRSLLGKILRKQVKDQMVDLV
ncbi:Long-chain-fatty-acid--CoA ligase [compost metagenome]